jgi:hypothetical protein
MAVFLIYEDFFTEMPHPPHYLCPIGHPLRSTKHLLKTMGFSDTAGGQLDDIDENSSSCDK